MKLNVLTCWPIYHCYSNCLRVVPWCWNKLELIYVINGVSQSALVGWHTDCTDIYSTNNENILQCSLTLCLKWSQMLPSSKNHKPSAYKQPFYKFSLTFSSFLFQIAILGCHQFLIFSNAQIITTSLSSLCTSSSNATSLIFLVPLLCCP